MPNLNIIKQDLLVARHELEEEIAQIDRVFQALGQPASQQHRQTGGETQRPPTNELVESVSKILRDSHRPIQNQEIADKIGMSNRSSGRALSFLKKQGKASFERTETGVFWRWKNG